MAYHLQKNLLVHAETNLFTYNNTYNTVCLEKTKTIYIILAFFEDKCKTNLVDTWGVWYNRAHERLL